MRGNLKRVEEAAKDLVESSRTFQFLEFYFLSNYVPTRGAQSEGINKHHFMGFMFFTFLKFINSLVILCLSYSEKFKY